MTRRGLIKVLGYIQNQGDNWKRDILTITGCGMGDNEVREHVWREFKQLKSELDRIQTVEYAKTVAYNEAHSGGSTF